MLLILKLYYQLTFGPSIGGGTLLLMRLEACKSGCGTGAGGETVSGGGGVGMGNNVPS